MKLLKLLEMKIDFCYKKHLEFSQGVSFILILNLERHVHTDDHLLGQRPVDAAATLGVIVVDAGEGEVVLH